MEFKQSAKVLSIVLLVGTILGFVFAVLVWSGNIYGGIIYLVFSLIQLVAFVFLFPAIVRGKDLHTIGNNTVLLCWVMLSIALTAMALILAPFFEGKPVVISYVAFAVYIIQVGVSIFTMYEAVKKAKADLII